MKEQFSSGDEIFREGDPAEAAYVIDSGEVEIVKELKSTQTLQLLLLLVLKERYPLTFC